MWWMWHAPLLRGDWKVVKHRSQSQVTLLLTTFWEDWELRVNLQWEKRISMWFFGKLNLCILCGSLRINHPGLHFSFYILLGFWWIYLKLWWPLWKSVWGGEVEIHGTSIYLGKRNRCSSFQVLYSALNCCSWAMVETGRILVGKNLLPSILSLRWAVMEVASLFIPMFHFVLYWYNPGFSFFHRRQKITSETWPRILITSFNFGRVVLLVADVVRLLSNYLYFPFFTFIFLMPLLKQL